jgi:hypothetical protein
MRKLVRTSSIITAALLLTTTAVGAQNCSSCSSGSPIGKYSDGDGAPLYWAYAAYLVSPGAGKDSALHCYFRQIDNRSGSDVRDVRWVVANFFRRVIPKTSSRTSCPLVAGETKPSPSNGPLYFDTSSNGYDTTVLEPKNGWGDQASNDRWNSPSFPPLRTEIAADIDDGTGKTILARVVFESSVKQDNRTFYLTYVVDSDVDLAVLLNLEATPQMLEKVPMLEKPFLLRAKKPVPFFVTTEGPVSAQPATVVLYDSKERISAIDTGGFYTIDGGKKQRPDRSFWQSIR